MLGLDVSKRTLSYSLLAPATQQLLAQGTVHNTPTGIAQLLEQIPPGYAWVLEPTGRYGDALAQAAQAAGRTVLHANPRQAQAFLRAVHPRAKTDRLDSVGLAQYALAVELRPYPRKSQSVDEITQLLAARRGVSQSLMRLRQQQQQLPLAGGHLDGAIQALEGEQRALDRSIAQAVAASELAADVARLQTIPGIGALTATAVAACLTSKRFVHPDKFVAYLGLDVQIRESGQWQGRARLSQQGDAELRRLLYCCAQATLRRRAAVHPFRERYERERAKGLSSTAALCVVARKLAKTCWSLVQHQTTYDATRVGRQG
jgi:transposase